MTSEVELTGTLHCRNDADTAVVRHAAPEHIRLSRAEPGCLAFDLHETAEPGVWRVAERFVDRGAFEAHQRRTRGSAWWSATGHLRRDFSVTGIPEDTSVTLAPTSGRVQVGLSSLPDALRHDPVVVLDGGLGTHLERRGLDVSGVLWSAASRWRPSSRSWPQRPPRLPSVSPSATVSSATARRSRRLRRCWRTALWSR